MRKNVYTKVLASIFMVLLLVIFLLEIANFIVIRQFWRSAGDMYQNSLEYYSSSWADRMKRTNTSLLSLMGTQGSGDFETICLSDDSLQVEFSKINLTNMLADMAYLHENEIRLFVYVPERKIFLASPKRLGSYENSKQYEQSVKEYISASKTITNSSQWTAIDCSGQILLLQVYQMGNGYAGAYLECETILSDLLSGKKAAEVAAIQKKDGEVVAASSERITDDSLAFFYEELPLTDYLISLRVSTKNIYSGRLFIILLTVGAVLLGLTVTLVGIGSLSKKIFHPLIQLRMAMEEFSNGNMEIRLKDNSQNSEVRILYRTFNHMAEQIKNLKINVYETMLQKQQIQSSYLRVQIQPHFYTNILNLIYNFAQIEDYVGIQRLILYTTSFFRYLLREKGDFVALEWEIECIDNYVNIQKIRYPDLLEVKVNNNIDGPAQIPPLLIQTFVENSIKHNITWVPRVEVDVHIMCVKERTQIMISDNGIGFPEELLARINADEDIEENGKHIGIFNVKRRLEYLYHKDAVITIENRQKGSVIWIDIPDIRMRDGEVLG